MEPLLNDLRQILNGQNEVVDGLLAAAKEHNQALRDNDHVTIMSSVQKQERLSGKLRELDRRREEVQRQLARVCGLGDQVVLSKLLPHAPAPAAAELGRLAGELKEKLVELDEVNQLNGVLARRGLQFTQQLSRILTPGGSSTYQGSGQLRKEGKPLSILDKTI